MKKFYGLMTLIVGVMLAFGFAGCGDGGGGGGGSLDIPAYAKNAPASAEALAAQWEENAQFSNVEAYGDTVSAIRTVGTKQYSVVASKDANNKGYFESMYEAYKTAISYAKKQGVSEKQIRKAYEDEGMYDFQISSKGASWTDEDGYECFYYLVGDWIYIQMPALL